MLRPNLILVAVAREMRTQSVRWFAGVPSADNVRDYKKIATKVERLASTVKRIDESGRHEVGTRSGGAMKQQNSISDCATRVVVAVFQGLARYAKRDGNFVLV
jgi:hypothetical protein